ncbi:hypothetical protein MAJJADAN_00021 [Pseudomonas phage Amjad_SA]|nr:hypothetical protein MAJJADAN_00021 [Pseudomonas phage Amjad_SA]
MTAGFQQTVQLQQAAAVAGDFASANPRASVVSHEGTLVAGVGGVIVGRFAWADANGKVTNAGSGKPTGFVHRRQGAALITAYLDETSNVVPEGFEVTLMATGDYWVAHVTSPATVDQKVFASLTTGEITTDAAGATVVGFIETDFFVTGFPVGGTGAVGELIVMSRVQ